MKWALVIVLGWVLAGCWLEPVPGPEQRADGGVESDGG